MIIEIVIFAAGVLTGWIIFEKPEKARNAWDWVKGQFSKDE